MGILDSTRRLLIQWGRWGASSIHLGLPTMSPMFGERALKTPLYGPDDGPPDILETDKAVCRLEAQERIILIERYQWRWQIRESMTEHSWSARRYYRQLDQALYAVRAELDRPYCAPRNNMLNKTLVSITVSAGEQTWLQMKTNPR